MQVQKLKKVGVAYTLDAASRKIYNVALVSLNANQHTKSQLPRLII